MAQKVDKSAEILPSFPIAADSKLKLIGTSDNPASPAKGSPGPANLYAGFHRGGSIRTRHPGGLWQSHEMGYWHFVMATQDAEGPSQSVVQWYIPQYKMADCMRQQDHFFRSSSYPQATLAEWMPFPTLISGRNKLVFCIGHLRFPLKAAAVKWMKKDLSTLKAALERIKVSAIGKSGLPDLSTPKGNPVEFENEEMIRAIAFEKEVYPELSADNFGVYSAYCTYRDFQDTDLISPSLIKELLEVERQNDPANCGKRLTELFRKTQEEVLGDVIWGKGIERTIRRATSVLSAGMKRLTQIQRTQFILMNGMHRTGLLMPLATVAGICTFEDYANFICEGVPPGSPEDQERRCQVSYIKLFGQLGSDVASL